MEESICVCAFERNMKSILIFSHAMELGGAEKALLGLLDVFDGSAYQVDLFLMRHSGELLKHIPEKVHLLPEQKRYACLAVPISQVLGKGQIGVAVGRLRGKLAAKKRIKQLQLPPDNDVPLQYSHKYTMNAMPMVGDREYDLAISFLTPHYFVTEKVWAKKKIAWIHTDYSRVAVDREEQLRMWEQYDRIVSISEQVTASFVEAFPQLSDKTLLIPHIMPVNYILDQANAFSTAKEMPDDGTLKLLSVGRFCTAKNFDNIPRICRAIREKGLNIKWYLIGYGGSEDLVRKRIAEAGMEDYVIILGKKENPYPYMKACDLYVQPSRYEGKCVSVIEAQILGKPVVITNYPTSSSQLEDGVDGVIVPLDNEGCAAGIAALLRDPEQMEKLRRNCATRDYSNAEQIIKIYEMME